MLAVSSQLIGRKFAVGTLIGMAYAYEKHTQHRRPPPMPEQNTALETLSVPEYNNLLLSIGYDTYRKVLAKSKPDEFAKDLTPDIFQTIVKDKLRQIRRAN